MRLLTKLLGSSVLLLRFPLLALGFLSVLELNLTIIVEFILARFIYPWMPSTDMPLAELTLYTYY